MKVPLSWLREFVELDVDPAELCRRLTMGGLEVEGVVEMGREIADVLVGEIVATAAHPAAERLTVCQVRTGEQIVPVVCGATNMKAGDRVAFAPPGATLPGGKRVDSRDLRGVFSAGMLCSGAELGLSDDESGILLLDPDAPLGARVGPCIGIEDTVLDVSVTPNRGDCLSILGMAREIAALGGGVLKRGRITVRERGAPASEACRVRIEDGDGCARYAARVVRQVRVGPSPLWLQMRLRAVGLRPINNVVDVTNLVMMERGQPLHAFDLDRLPRPEIVVRRAGGTRSLRTLDGEERSLDPRDLLITTGEEPVALAGVMGGASTEVSAATSSVLLESAWFDPATVRRTARRLDLHSEAAYRFERGVDIGGITSALDRAAALLRQLDAAEVAPGVVEAYPVPHVALSIRLRPKRVQELIGFPIGRTEITATLKSLGASVSAGAQGSLVVAVPTFRSDLTREIDLVEEIARVLGYERIPASTPTARLGGEPLPLRILWTRELKRVLCGLGLSETIGLSFASGRSNELFPGLDTRGNPVRLVNPLSVEEPELRRSLLPGLLAAWRQNRHQGLAGVALFAEGKAYWREGATCEGWRLAGLVAGPLPRRGLGSPAVAEFADVKGIVEAVLDRLGLVDVVRWEPLGAGSLLPRGEEGGGAIWAGAKCFHPGKSAFLHSEGDVIGVVGALHPDVEVELGVEEPLWVFELDTERLLSYVAGRRLFRGLPRFPAVIRDLAVVVEQNFPSDRVLRYVRDWRRGPVEEVVLFDEYVGAPIPAGKRSLAYSISYRAADRTLTDEEVNELHRALTEALCRDLSVEPR